MRSNKAPTERLTYQGIFGETESEIKNDLFLADFESEKWRVLS